MSDGMGIPTSCGEGVHPARGHRHLRNMRAGNGSAAGLWGQRVRGSWPGGGDALGGDSDTRQSRCATSTGPGAEARRQARLALLCLHPTHFLMGLF